MQTDTSLFCVSCNETKLKLLFCSKVIVAFLFDSDTGYPSGKESCPMPLYVIVHFPSYSGLPFFSNYPRTWVPVPQSCIQHKDRKSLSRTGTPLKLSWAMTIHKSQGLTAAEGCIVDLRTSSKRNPVALSGLAFVAWTRTESFDRLAFKSLPSLLHFFECRQHKDFKLREKFELEASKKHDLHLLNVYGLTPMQEVEQHYAHTEQMIGRPLLDEEKSEIKVALLRQGMQSLSPDLEQWIARSEGASRFATLADIARSFKGKRASCKSEGIKSGRLAKAKKKFDVFLDLYQPLLLNMGFEAAVVAKALSTGILDLNKLIDQCMPDSATAASDSIESGVDFLHDSYRAIGLEIDCTDNNRVEKDKRLATRRACKKKRSVHYCPLIISSHHTHQELTLCIRRKSGVCGISELLLIGVSTPVSGCP